MTFDDALAKAAAELDRIIEQAHHRFERSLIDHHAPLDDRDDLRAYEREYMQAWRESTLAEVREKLLATAHTARTETVH